ncbi:hypothetical protein [Endozoicomonas sp.]|uniref:hypothetical protein n=1 Tax=Endozoicomonas sp. TaxID=1892382 RepID=UPI003839D1E6
METQLAKAARNIYRYFDGQIDLQQVKSSFIYLFTGHESLPVGESARDTPLDSDFEHLVSAMQYDSMLNDWNEVMSATAELTDKDANRFLR